MGYSTLCILHILAWVGIWWSGVFHDRMHSTHTVHCRKSILPHFLHYYKHIPRKRDVIVVLKQSEKLLKYVECLVKGKIRELMAIKEETPWPWWSSLQLDQQVCVVCVCKLDAGSYLSACACVDGSLNELFRSCLMARWHKANELE